MTRTETVSAPIEWEDSLNTAPAAPIPEMGSVLCLADHESIVTDAAILRIASEFASPEAMPVLLLDLGQPANRFWRMLSRSGRFEHRPSPLASAPHQATLNFHRLRGINLMVSHVTPDPTEFDAAAWDLRANGALTRLHELFSRVVIVPPPLDNPATWTLAAAADATMLVLRKGRSEAPAAQHLRDQIIAAGGWPVGSVLVS